MLNLRKSICNLFCKGIQLPFIRFNFTIYPSWKDRNLMKFDKLPQVDDELKFPHESEEVTGGIKQVSFFV